MATPPTTADDESVVLTQMAESYRTMAHVAVHYTAEQLKEIRRSERLTESLRERLAEKDAEIAALKAELSRDTAAMVTEAA